MKLLTLKSNNSARRLHCCEVGAVPLKPMELQWQKSDLTKQDLACRTSFLIYVKHECNILITIHCINYWKSIKAWKIFRCNWKHEMWHWSPESRLFLFLIEITRIGKKKYPTENANLSSLWLWNTCSEFSLWLQREISLDHTSSQLLLNTCDLKPLSGADNQVPGSDQYEAFMPIVLC